MRSSLDGTWIVVARFGLFLQEFHVAQHAQPAQSYGFSLWFGTALIAVGVATNGFSGWHHVRLIRELNRGDMAHAAPATQAVAVAFFLALVGLVLVRSSTRWPFENGKEISVTLNQGKGIIDTASNHPMDQAVERLKGILFALIDHSGEAEKVGMSMRPTKLLIFGSPEAGTLPASP
jgi:hypothetical protein